MAIFSKSPKTNPAYAPSVEVMDAANVLSAALDARAQIDAAVAKNDAARTAAGDARLAADAEGERVEVELALQIDEAKIQTLEAAVASARATSANATTVADRADRLRGALHARAADADAAIAGARQLFQTALSTFGREASEALSLEAQEAAQPLVKILMRGHAIAAAIETLSQITGFLVETTISSPAPGQPAIIENGKADAAGGSRVDLSVAWRDDPAAAAVADLLRPLADLRRRAAGHLDFAHRAFARPAARPYEPNPANVAAACHNAEVDLGEANLPPPPAWTGRVREFGEHPRDPKLDVNVVAGIADNAMVDLGFALNPGTPHQRSGS